MIPALSVSFFMSVSTSFFMSVSTAKGRPFVEVK